ncbi:MAG: hypothetical protein N2317_07805 [Syntrophales bacterium]|nr:hypothetical protein [Syntrophales bacterium]
MKTFFRLFAIIFFLSLPGYTFAGDKLCLQVFGGTAYNFKTRHVIRQDGADTVRFNAKYDTKAFETPVYWSLRAGLWDKKNSWELELVHHKLYLKNNPPGVEHFSITHGFNLLTVNRAWLFPWFIGRLGGGVVVTHPESTIHGKTFEQSGGIIDGYYISGPTAQVALEKRLYIGKNLFLSAEGKFTLSWVRVPVKDGHSELWNSAVHALLGIGYDFNSR